MRMDRTSLLLKLELFDGTSQIVQLTEEQAFHLGINIAEDGGPEFVVPAADDAAQRGGRDAAPNYMYKIVKPEDLDLKPVAASHAPRGRPRKRPIDHTAVPEEPKPFKEPQTVIKQVRTRSGRITKPPRHIRQDFKVMDNVLDAERIPPTTSVDPPPPPPQLHQSLERHSKKRNIPSHYRCPTCNKAYLGRIKMLNHFGKYPEHGPAPNFCKAKHNATWNYLVLTTQKFKDGCKGVKFCQELTVVLENVRYLAKFLFRPAAEGESGGYHIDEYLAHVFGIAPGVYVVNDGELRNDVSLHAFLEKKCRQEEEEEALRKKVKEAELSASETRRDGVNVAGAVGDSSESATREEDLPAARGTCFAPERIVPEEKHSMLSNGEAKRPRILSVPDATQRLINYHAPHTIGDEAGVNPSEEKSVKGSNNSTYDDLLTRADDLMLVSDKKCEGFAGGDEMALQSHVGDALMPSEDVGGRKPGSARKHARKQCEYDLDKQLRMHTELLSHVEDLILDNIDDAGQVSSILEASSGSSDDIMNVDQFVNERFKKLTEPDLELQGGASLNLDLPPLDMFNFHTS